MSTQWPDPVMVERVDNLGWLALSANDDPVRIGITGDTEEEARASFELRRAWWESLGWMPDPGPFRERQYGGAEHGGPA